MVIELFDLIPVSDAHGLVAPFALVTPDRLKPPARHFELMTAVRAWHREDRGQQGVGERHRTLRPFRGNGYSDAAIIHFGPRGCAGYIGYAITLPVCAAALAGTIRV